jgi:hypothetical protein
MLPHIFDFASKGNSSVLQQKQKNKELEKLPKCTPRLTQPAFFLLVLVFKAQIQEP